MKNMKKIVTITVMALATNFAFSQADAELKNFRFGLKVTPSLNWLGSENKLVSGDGIAPKIGGGVILEFKLAKVVSFETGIQINLDGGYVKYNNDGTNKASYYYSNIDDQIVKYNFGVPGLDSANYTHYQLNSRKYNFTYVTLPIALKLKTKEIGAFTYFGQVGLNTSFLWKARADDELNQLTTSSNSNVSKSGLDVTSDAAIVNLALSLGLGAEYNISGTTSLLMGLNYGLGFTNVVRSESEYINRKIAGGSATNNYPQSLKSGAIVLTVGVLF